VTLPSVISRNTWKRGCARGNRGVRQPSLEWTRIDPFIDQKGSFSVAPSSTIRGAEKDWRDHRFNPGCHLLGGELAQLDGGFVVSREGTVLSACRYLDAVAIQVDVPLGLGSRHIAAANMSAVTRAVGIVVSESSVVRLFLSWTTRRRNHSRGVDSERRDSQPLAFELWRVGSRHR
jgi:hypothetical protein